MNTQALQTQIATLTETLSQVATQLQALTAQLAAMQNEEPEAEMITIEELLGTEEPKANPLKELGLTKMETAVMEAFLPTLFEGELEYSETTVKDLTEMTGIEMKQMRGVLGSLVKKGIINCDHSAWQEEKASRKIEGNKRKTQKKVYVELREKFFYLHPSHE